jgi:hypothetical protein
MKALAKQLLWIAALCGVVMVSGCKTEAQTKAVWGTAIGAGAGQLIGGDTEATLIGAGIGAGAGYLWGSMQDNKKEDEIAAQTIPQGEDIETVWVTNSDGTRTAVQLRRTTSGRYVGERGEIYETLPTENELKERYGY